jgi:hypothetical protein
MVQRMRISTTPGRRGILLCLFVVLGHGGFVRFECAAAFSIPSSSRGDPSTPSLGWKHRCRHRQSIRVGLELLHSRHYCRKPIVRSATGSSNDKDPEQQQQQPLVQRAIATSIQVLLSSPTRSLAFSIFMALAGSILGPFLDSYHSAFGVLQYDKPWKALLWGTEPHPALTTVWWVPVLFGLAGLMIGWLYLLLDVVLVPSVAPHPMSDGGKNDRDTSDDPRRPTSPKILMGVSLFTLQYWLSGALYQSGVDRNSILQVMSVIAATAFCLLDQTFAGFLTSTATALGGPVIELGLLSISRAGAISGSGYHYNDLGETGFFPLWIVPVYFLGGPAVGNLARGVWVGLSHVLGLEALPCMGNIDPLSSTNSGPRGEQPPGCAICIDTRKTPCPNCDGLGDYVAAGGRTVVCTSCRGRGFVICRSCFSYYKENPNDLDAIREVVSRLSNE